MKKILVVQGGGRFNGNTSQLADAFIQGAMEADVYKRQAEGQYRAGGGLQGGGSLFCTA